MIHVKIDFYKHNLCIFKNNDLLFEGEFNSPRPVEFKIAGDLADFETEEIIN